MNRIQLDQNWRDMENTAGQRGLEACLATEPETTAGQLLRGIARFDSADWKGALEDFEVVLKAEPENRVAALHCSLAAWKTGDSARALACLKNAHPFPHDGFVRRFLEVFWPLRFEEAELRAFMPVTDPPEIPLIARAREAPPERKASFVAKLMDAAMGAISQEEYGRALALASAAVHLAPENEDCVSIYAALSLQSGRPEQARVACEKYLEDLLANYSDSKVQALLPDSAFISFWAMSLHEAGEHRAALAVLSRVRPEGPEDYRANLVAGLCWMMMGEKNRARECLDVALGAFFLDSWELVVEPFIQRVLGWMERSQEFEGKRPAENSSS